MDSAKVRIANPPPPDGGFLVYIVFFVHGIAAFSPWNIFAAMHQSYYLDYKLHPSYVNSTEIEPGHLSMWRSSFHVRMSVAALACNLVFTIINCVVALGQGRLGIRVLVSLCVLAFSFLVNIITAIVETNNSFFLFINMTIAATVLMNAALAVYHSSMWGIVAQLPRCYQNSVLMGNNFIGILTVVYLLVNFIMEVETKLIATVAFVFGTLLMVTVASGHLLVSIKRFFRYYVQHLEIAEIQGNDVPTVEIWKDHYSKYIDIFFVYFVSYLFYPNVTMWINTEGLFGLDQKYCCLIFNFLTFNAMAFAGNFIANFIHVKSSTILKIITFSRFLLLPMFFLLNFSKPGLSRRFDVILSQGWVFWIVSIVLGLSHGLASSWTMLAPNSFGAKPAMVSNVFMVAGITLGLACSLVFEKLLLFEEF